MATLQVLNPKGMIKDTNNTALPNEFFSHTQNARFEDNAAKKVLGQDQVFGTPTVERVIVAVVPSAGVVDDVVRV